MKQIKVNGMCYPYRCSFCEHFRMSVQKDAKGNPVCTEYGSPVLDSDHTSCALRRTYKVNEWSHQEHGVNPFQDVAPDCAQFALPDYYYMDWQGLRATAVIVDV